MDPFAAGLRVLFRGPRSAAAVYQPWGQPPRVDPIRVIRGSPDMVVDRVVEGANMFQFIKADVPSPRRGDRLTIGSETFELLGEAIGSVEGLTWTMGGAPVE